MTTENLQHLERLLRLYRDDAVDRDEFEKRESLRFDVAFEIEMRNETKQEMER